MKIILVHIGNIDRPGIIKKYKSLIKEFNNNGIGCQGIFITEQIDNDYFDSNDNILYKKFDTCVIPKIFKKGRLWPISLILRDKLIFKLLHNTVGGLQNEYQYIMMRYKFGDIFFYKWSKKYKGKFITEHNTHELNELKLYKNTRKNLYWSYYYYSEKFWGPKILSNTAAITGVTNEICNFEVNRNKNRKKSFVLSNSIVIDNYKKRFAPDYVNNDVNLIMLCGKIAQWHGIDRIIYGVNNYKGPKNIRIYLIGEISQRNKELIEKLDLAERIKHIDFLSSKELDPFFDKCHAAIGSLSLHKNNMSEASTLKVREYIARGIPFVIGYKDTDLTDNSSISDFYLKVPSNDMPIDFISVCQFIDNVYKTGRDHVSEIRSFGKRTIDSKIKAKNYKLFLNSIQN